jgi:hypothetical protein
MIFPETGKLAVLDPPLNGPLFVTYHYGFSSTLGAGPYDRRIIGQAGNPTPAPISKVKGGGPIAAIPSTGTVSINDSLTYTSVRDVNGIDQVTILAANAAYSLIAPNNARPVIRLAAGAVWNFTGNAGSTLILEGLFVSGGDIVLRGRFDTVTLTCCTFDPGNSGDSAKPPTVFSQSVDGRDLVPTRLWVEAHVRQLNIDRCILSQVRTRNGGDIEALSITDSILQAIRTSGFGLLSVADLKDPTLLASRLHDAGKPQYVGNPLSLYLYGRLIPPTETLLSQYHSSQQPFQPPPALQQDLVQDLNAVLTGPPIHDPLRFADVRITSATKQLIARRPSGPDLARLNRRLLEEAYPVELADLTLGLVSGRVSLSRCTLLGPARVHRMEASECILDDVVVVDDAQDGCVRFSAWSTGSVLPRQYESVAIAPGESLFTSRDFGQPGYAQLLQGVDNAIVSGAKAATISAGAENGSEMGAFARDKNPIKERSLLIKYREFMPLGLDPVIIYVT